jgi:hypothetical protein
VEGIEGDKKIMPVSRGSEIYASTEQMHAARNCVERGDAVPAVLGKDTATSSLEEIHTSADVDEARGGGIGLCDNAIGTLARRSNVESPRGEPHQLGRARRDQVVRTGGWRGSFRA